MIVSSGTKKPNIHASAYVAPSATVSGDVTIDGRCTSLTSLSDFVASLEASSYFAKPVEIVDSTVDAATPTAPEVIRFSVKAKFVSPAN